MKKRLIAFGLVFAFVLSVGGVAAATGGAQSDPLISKSYLEGTFLSELNTKIDQWVQQMMQPAYDNAEQELEELAAGYLSNLGAGDAETLPEGWRSDAEYVVGGGDRADTVSLSAGSSILWTSGSGTASAVLIDVTSGTELAAGGTLTADHRYIAADKAVITVTSRNAYWSVQGVWTTTSDGVSEVTVDFEDVPEGSWYYDAVYYVVDKNLYNGTSETTFSPLMTMQRGMLTTVLYRLAGSPEVEYTAIFSDVPDGKWYTDGTIWAGQQGVVSGTGKGTFLPGDNVARQQIAVILYNYATKMGYDTSDRGDLTAFSDRGSVASWAETAMSWAVSVGILQGSSGKVMPTNGASRAEVAIMLQRFQTWVEAQ